MNAIRRVSQSSFFRGVIAIAGGTALAQAVGVLLSPLLTRLYTPEAVGLWGLFMSFLGVTSVAATLRYEVAIVAASSEEEALALTRSSLVLGLGVGLLGALALEGLRRGHLLGYGALPAWASFLAFPALVAFAWGTALRYYGVRRGAFGRVGRFTVTQGVARPLAQLLLAFLGGAGLLLGEVLGRFLGLIALWRLLPRTSGPWFSPGVLARYRTYPLVQLPSGFLNMLALMAPVPVFTALYGPAVGGGLALAQRVVGLPVSLIGAAVADVFYGRAAELARERPQALRGFLLATAFRLFLLALPFGLALWFLAPRFAPWVFGSAWEEAGRMMAAMAPWMVAQMTVSSVSRAVFLSKKAWVKFVYDLAALAVFGAPFYLHGQGQAVWVLGLISWLNVALYVFYLLVLIWITGPKELWGYRSSGAFLNSEVLTEEVQ
ncbi:lipopolysaccharide biosynthesis protein [Rhodothermus marinus]|uniref:lipopolysaccharide biosynthesis protein n=1 Tax=Rhodothermus marinus TaxID=29549 RepID=UPI001A7E48E7|nr:oligosaccharide flippase family protein [Rhodothermus marinus]